MNHHHTCHECERRRQQYQDEAFADMLVLAQFHPEWFHFGDDHAPHHDDHGVFAGDDVCDDPDMDMDMDMDDMEAMGFWD